MTSIQIKVEGETRIIAVLNAIALSGQQRAQLFDEIGFNLVENAQLRFIDGVSPDGQAWVQSIRAKQQGGQTLIDKGTLRASLNHNVLSDGVEYGTNLPYAAPNHFGANIKAVNAPFLRFKIGGKFVSKKSVVLPARPFVGVSAEDELMVLDVFNSFISRTIQ